jgi:biotin carboxylase
VPACLAPAIDRSLVDCVRRLVDVTGYRDGVLHSEWILVDGNRPHLIECAARLPGDSIDRLIDLAYGGRLTRDYLAVLEGERPEPAVGHRRGAAIRFLTASPGTVHQIVGTEHAAAVPGVEEVSRFVTAGTAVAPVACSWDRLGHIVATGVDGREAAARVAAAAAMIRIETREAA